MYSTFKVFVLPSFWPRNFPEEYGPWAGNLWIDWISEYITYIWWWHHVQNSAFYFYIAQIFVTIHNVHNFLFIYLVVTGCSKGIGLCYANELAKKGMNLVLIARKVELLNQIAEEIRKKYGVQVEVIIADFGHGATIYKDIEEGLANKDIGILVNNVGVAYDRIKYFHEESEEKIRKMINVNSLNLYLCLILILVCLPEEQWQWTLARSRPLPQSGSWSRPLRSPGSPRVSRPHNGLPWAPTHDDTPPAHAGRVSSLSTLSLYLACNILFFCANFCILEVTLTREY